MALRLIVTKPPETMLAMGNVAGPRVLPPPPPGTL